MLYVGEPYEGDVFDAEGRRIGSLVRPKPVQSDTPSIDPQMKTIITRQLGGCKGCGDPGAQELANG